MTTQATFAAMAETMRKETTPRVGDIYFNPRRGNCLRVDRITGEFASCMSYRPNGAKGSLPLHVKLESLRKDYLPVLSIEVVTPLGAQRWDSIGGDKWEAK